MGASAAAKIGRQQPIRMHLAGVDPPQHGPGIPALAASTDEARLSWAELLDAFHDRRAASRFERDTTARVDNRWRPRLALVLPGDFSFDRPAHRRDLAVALEILAATTEQYNVEVVSDSDDASRLFDRVRPYSAGVLSGCRGALVLGSRALNDEVSALLPSRYVAADPCAFRPEARRLVFEAGRTEWPFERADEEEVASACRHGVSAFLDENDDAPAYIEALRRLAEGCPKLRVTLSSRTDEAFAARVREAFVDLPRVEVVDPPKPGPDGPDGFVLSNEPIVLLTQRDPSLPGFLFRRDRFFWVDSDGPSRLDLYLHRGEEADSARLVARWLGRGASASTTKRRPAREARPEGVVQPLVSIVVPVYDRTTELVRLASSIFHQHHPWIEVLFVSNGSPPETLEALRVAEGHLMKRRFRVRTIELPGACGSATIPRDVGSRSASGDLICVLDSDDWLEQGFFDFLALANGGWRDDTIYYPKKVFRNFGRSMSEDFPWDTPLAGPGTIEAVSMPGTLKRLGNFLCNSGVCFSRALFDRAGGIDLRLHYGEDLYLWWRCALVGARAQGHDGIVNIALHPGNNELAVGEDRRLDEAVALACDRGRSQWL